MREQQHVNAVLLLTRFSDQGKITYLKQNPDFYLTTTFLYVWAFIGENINKTREEAFLSYFITAKGLQVVQDLSNQSLTQFVDL